jgi:hypothetical protein
MKHIEEFEEFKNKRKNDENDIVLSVDKKIKVDDFFDIDSISKKDIVSITNDMRAFFQIKHYDSYSDYEERELVTEDIDKTLSIIELKVELKKLGFKSWQIKSEKLYNRNRIAILYVDMAKNTEIIKEEMESFGWEYADISDVFVIHKTNCRVMTFDPSFPKEISKTVFSSKYIYHWTPIGRVSSILKEGIEPRSENTFLKYKPKVHLIKENITKIEASILGWQLFKANTTSSDGRYCLLRIEVEKLSKSTIFYGDTRCEYGITTKCPIPADAVEIFGEIEYKDKSNYHREILTVIADKDTMDNTK